jgi:prefoldin subunit 5
MTAETLKTKSDDLKAQQRAMVGQLNELKGQQEQLVANINAIQGAIQVLDELMAQDGEKAGPQKIVKKA